MPDVPCDGAEEWLSREREETHVRDWLRWLMISGLLLPIVLFVQAMVPTSSEAADEPVGVEPSQAQVVEAEDAASEPAAAEAADVPDGTIDLMKVFNGQQKLTAEQLIELGPWINALGSLLLTVLAFIPRLVVAAFLLGVFWLLYRTVRRLILGAMARAGVDESIRDMLLSIVKWTILGFGGVVACNQLGIPIVAMLTGVSIIGLAVGFAAQETLANFIAGIVIFWDRPFQVGHWVDVGGTFGQVQRVTFRSTRILTGDGETVIMPNTMMLNQKLINSTPHPVQRVRVPIGIAYKESIDAARAVLLGIVIGDDRIVSEPPPAVVVTGCNASSVDLELRFWITDESIERRIGLEYIERMKKALDAAGIQIPFPHMQLFLEETPALAKLASQPQAPARMAG
jgi:small conductance mechanosensitive channel